LVDPKTISIFHYFLENSRKTHYIAFAYLILKSILETYNVGSSFIAFMDNYRIIWICMLIAALFTLLTGIIYLYKNKHLFQKRESTTQNI